ncbi:MAG TPA: phosphoglycerate dehydrogenase [Clostridia bacterium]|nr:phosphoglycerate dehydrogenase [Clostridia bacterium]
MKIVVAEKIAASAMDLLASVPGWQVVGPGQFASDPQGSIRDAEGLIVRSAVRADAALVRHANKLRVIGRAGVGVDNIDVDVATRRGIVVMNTPGASAVAVAELTIGLMLSLARHIPRADQSTRAGNWDKKSFAGTELLGKTLGIVGLGRIGTEVCKRSTALGMNVCGSDPYVSPAFAAEVGVKLCTLEELYSQSDFISLHVALTHQTTGMLNASAFAKMKRGVRIVNCARGELVDEYALADALRSGQVAAAALDVFPKEPPKVSPLLALPSVVATPHIGASTQEAQDAVGTQIASQLRDYLMDGVVQNAVNSPSLTDLEYQQLKPYIALAHRMASVLAQLFDSNLEEVRIRYEGALTGWKTELLQSSAVAGILQYGSEETVNIINAQAAAQARGVRVVESRSDSNTKMNTVQISLHGASLTLAATGTVVHGESPRIIELNGIEIESPLTGNFIVISNLDRPGVIGRIGTLLSDHGINIARFSLGRESEAAAAANATGAPLRRKALAIVQTDTPVPKDVLNNLNNIDAVISVHGVHV